MARHSLITDPNIHEPKDISTAAVKTVYKANGAGTGLWEPLRHMVGGRLGTGGPSTSEGMWFQMAIPIRSKLSDIRFNRKVSDSTATATITVSRNGTTIATGTINNTVGPGGGGTNNTVTISIPADTIFEVNDEFKIHITYASLTINASFGCYFQEV